MVLNQCDLVVGDINETANQHFEREEKKLSLMYIDCNAYRAALNGTYAALPRLSNNVLIVIDEHTVGGETKALCQIAEETDQCVYVTADTVGIPFL